jgi:hypothetical protein
MLSGQSSMVSTSGSTAGIFSSSGHDAMFPTSPMSVKPDPAFSDNLFAPQSVGLLSQQAEASSLVQNKPVGLFTPQTIAQSTLLSPQQAVVQSAPAVTSPNHELSKEDLEAFNANYFVIGKVPEHAPPQELC